MKKSVVLFFAVIFSLSIFLIAPTFCSALQEPEVKELLEGNELQQEIVVDKYNPALKRSLLIFLDNYEAYWFDKETLRHPDILTIQAYFAIVEKAGPLLISGSILYRLFRMASNKDRQLTAELFDKFYNYFRPKEWIIRKVPESKQEGAELYCLIPQGYQNIARENLQRLKAQDPISETEYKLGIKIEHMDPIPDQDKATLRSYFSEKYDQYNERNWRKLDRTTDINLINNLPNIFVQKSDYIKTARNSVLWILYLNGHGTYGRTIASVSFALFKALLSFFENKITTIFFVYESCFAAGLSSQQIYGDLTGQSGTQIYSFPIIAMSLPDSQTLTSYREFRYNLFVQAFDPSSHDYYAALSHIIPPLQELYVTNYPQLRPAYAPAWFPIIKNTKTIVQITKTMSATRTKPLIISNNLDNIAAILLYAERVPFSIQITSNNTIPLFVSAAPGKATHVVDELSATQFSKDKVLEKLTVGNGPGHSAQLEYSVDKTVIFKTVKTKDATLQNVILSFKPNKKPMVYFTQAEVQKLYTPGKLDTTTQADKNGTISNYTGSEYTNKLMESNIIAPNFFYRIKNFFSPNSASSHAAQLVKMRALEKKVNQRNVQSSSKTANLRTIHAYHLIKKSLYPRTNKAQRRNLRYLLEQLSKSDPGAIQYLRDILFALANGQEEKAARILGAAYGGSHSIGYDFPLKELDRISWEQAIKKAVDRDQFYFLGEEILSGDPTLTSY